MINFDQLLQEKLAALEAGVPLDEVLKDLPPEAAELEPLLKLASRVSNLEQPSPSAIQAQKVMAAARGIKPAQLARQAPRWALPVALGSALALLMLMAVVFAAGAWWLARSGPVTLVDADGYVEVASSPAGDRWRALEVGDHLREGQRLRTYVASQATLRLSDGSLITLDSLTDITLVSLARGKDGALQVLINQNSGETSHRVTPRTTSTYEVTTQSGTASVHGTSFDVFVAPAGGLARFAVTSGEVQVSANGKAVTVMAGQATTTLPQHPPEPVAYQYTLEGPLEVMADESLSVAGLPLATTQQTILEGSPALGDPVRVLGRLTAEGAWVADVIFTERNQQRTDFHGILEAGGENVWQVSGVPVLIDPQTTIASGLQEGQMVSVAFVVDPNNQWTAVDIRSSEPPPEQNDQGGSPASTAELEFVPDELSQEACQTDFSLTGTLVNTSLDPGNNALTVALGYTVLAGAEYMEDFSLAPDAWEVIHPGEQVTFTIQVALTDAWLTAPNGTEFQVVIFVEENSNNPGAHSTELTVTLGAGCLQDTATPTVTATATAIISGTATATATVTPTPTITPTPNVTPSPTAGFVNCTGANPHPTGTRLAQRYGVPYEEIMGWFCQHFGFGEIDLAYTLSRSSGVPVADIFAMKSSGMGWGNIRRQLSPDSHPGRGPNH